MAKTYKAVLVFEDADGKAVTLSFNHANPNTEKSDIDTAMTAIITNGEIYKRVPVKKKSACLIASEQTDFNVG